MLTSSNSHLSLPFLPRLVSNLDSSALDIFNNLPFLSFSCPCWKHLRSLSCGHLWPSFLQPPKLSLLLSVPDPVADLIFLSHPSLCHPLVPSLPLLAHLSRLQNERHRRDINVEVMTRWVNGIMAHTFKQVATDSSSEILTLLKSLGFLSEHLTYPFLRSERINVNIWSDLLHYRGYRIPPGISTSNLCFVADIQTWGQFCK